MGVIRSHTLPYAASNNIISTFRHAIALDEHRSWFTVDPWHIPEIDRARRKNRFFTRTFGVASDPNSQGLWARLLLWLAFGRQQQVAEVERAGRAPGVTCDKLFALAPNAKPPTDVKEVWFAGCHSGELPVSIPPPYRKKLT